MPRQARAGILGAVKSGAYIVLVGLSLLGCSRATRSRQDASHSTPALPSATSHSAAVAPAAPAPESLARQINNEQLDWLVIWYEEQKTPQSLDINVYADGWTELYYDQIMGAERRQMTRALVGVMDDPTRIVAAHCALGMIGESLPDSARRLADVEESPEFTKPPTAPVVVNYRGLKVNLTPYRTSIGVSPGGLTKSIHCRVFIDPEQFPSLRARWEQHLRDVGHP